MAGLVGGHDSGAKRAVTVGALADEPLLVLVLQIAGGDIVADRVTVNVAEGVFPGDAAALLADDHGEFALVVDGAGRVQLRENGVAGTGNAGGRLGENDRMIRNGCRASGGVKAGIVEFPGMFVIVPPHRHYVPARHGDWREQFDLTHGMFRVVARSRDGIGRPREGRIAGFDEAVHVGGQVRRGSGKADNNIAIQDADGFRAVGGERN